MEHLREPCFTPLAQRRMQLSPQQQILVMEALPAGATVIAAAYFDNYNLPCPIRVQAQLGDGTLMEVVLRLSRRGDVAREADVLGAVGRCGLPVPKVLAGPKSLEQDRTAVVLSLLPGMNLQKLSMCGDEGLANARQLMALAIGRLEQLTPSLGNDPVGTALPRRSLGEELQAILDPANPWLQDPSICRAIDLLRGWLAEMELPLVFSNGDLQPANFLTDGNEVTGFVDFESAHIGDPLLGIAKYPVYDLHPLNKGGFVEAFLASRKIERALFEFRVAVFALNVLRTLPPPSATTNHGGDYQIHLLSLLHHAIRTIGQRMGCGRTAMS